MIIFALAIFSASLALTWWIERYCVARGIVDVPNARSAHSQIVARGGGIGFSFLFLVAILALGAQGTLPWRVTLALSGGGAVVVLTGWTDDRRGLSQIVRAILHLLAAAWAVYWIGFVPPFSPGPVFGNFGWTGSLVTIVAVAWMVNLYNFMDGTDGIAGVEAVTVGLLAGGLCVAGGVAAIGHVYWLLAAAVAGFLIWNWPPARIFMGDAGSGFLGFAFAALVLWCAVENGRLLWPSCILLSVFFADATTTLLVRMSRGEKWYEAHSSHAYQRLARRWGHRPVALGVSMINVLILGPASWVAWTYPESALPLALLVNMALAAAILVIRRRLD